MIFMDLKDIKLTTVIIIIALLVIGLYAVTEVNYYSYKEVVEPKEINSSVVIIPSIEDHEKINNVSIRAFFLSSPSSTEILNFFSSKQLIKS